MSMCQEIGCTGCGPSYRRKTSTCTWTNDLSWALHSRNKMDLVMDWLFINSKAEEKNTPEIKSGTDLLHSHSVCLKSSKFL